MTNSCVTRGKPIRLALRTFRQRDQNVSIEYGVRVLSTMQVVAVLPSVWIYRGFDGVGVNL